MSRIITFVKKVGARFAGVKSKKKAMPDPTKGKAKRARLPLRTSESLAVAKRRAMAALRKEAKAEAVERKRRLDIAALRAERKVRVAKKVKRVFKAREWERKWGKTALRIGRDISERKGIKRDFEAFKKRLKGMKPSHARGWYAFYEMEVCDQSPPCDPEDPTTRWELRTRYISSQRKIHVPNLERQQFKLYSKISSDIQTRNWRLYYYAG